jgi:hypothetical protein
MANGSSSPRLPRTPRAQCTCEIVVDLASPGRSRLPNARPRPKYQSAPEKDVVLSFIYAGAPYLRQTTKFNPGIPLRTTAVDSYSAPRSHYGLRETGLDEDDAAVGQSENAADNDSLKMEARFQRVEATRANSPSDLPKFGDRFVT